MYQKQFCLQINKSGYTNSKAGRLSGLGWAAGWAGWAWLAGMGWLGWAYLGASSLMPCGTRSHGDPLCPGASKGASAWLADCLADCLAG